MSSGNEQNYISALPDLALQNLLSYLSCVDIQNFGQTSKYFYDVCLAKLYKSVSEVQIVVKSELGKVCDEMNLSLLDCKTIGSRNHILCRYIMMDFLYSEISVLFVICTHMRRIKCFDFPADLLDFMNFIIYCHRTPIYFEWMKMKLMQRILSMKMNKFIDNFCAATINTNPLQIGTLLMDFLDIINQIKYSSTVKYNTKTQTCYIDAEYFTENSKTLTLLYLASQFYSCTNRVLTETERSFALKAIILFVQIQNHMALRDKHYDQMITLQKKIEQEMREYIAGVDHEEYHDTFLHDNTRKIRCTKESISDHEILESYSNIADDKEGKNGFRCKIRLECAFNEAPIELSNNIKTIQKHSLLDGSNVPVNKDKAYGVDMQINAHFPSYICDHEMEMFEAEYTEGILHNDNFESQCYLEHTGTTLYSDKQIENVCTDLKSNIFGNPHAHNTSSKSTEDAIDQIRFQILQHFNTSSDDYSVIFTSGATAALKLVAETFDYSAEHKYYDVDDGILLYLEDNHTSVLGMRQYAPDFQVLTHDDAIEIFKTEITRTDSVSYGNSLFVYPAQCNYSGIKYPLSWVNKVKEGVLNNVQRLTPSKWYCMVDAASYAATNSLNLSLYQPDFICISFYKIFGYPTGLGALLVKKTSAGLLRKKYFGGGTVQMATHREFVPRNEIHEWFEDGTISFLSILSLRHGFDTLKRFNLDMSSVSEHTYRLGRYLHHSLMLMHHFNGMPVAVLYHDLDFECAEFQGGIVNFNLRRASGQHIGYAEVLNMAELHGIHLRTGCFCNPGACQRHLRLTDGNIKHHFKSGHVCGDQNDIIDGQPTGSIRASFGYMSTKKDADKLLQMVEECFVKKPLIKKIPNTWEAIQEQSFQKFAYSTATYTVDLTVNNKVNGFAPKNKVNGKIDKRKRPNFMLLLKDLCVYEKAILRSILVYPIKSCGPHYVEDNWEIGPVGLVYDRMWMVATSAGVCLTQKQEARLCLIKPIIKIEEGILELSFPGMPIISVPLEPNDTSRNSNVSLCQTKVCGDKVKCIDCGDEISDWLSEALNRSNFRLLRQLPQNSRQNRKGNDTQLSLANQAQFLLINTESVRFLLKSIPSMDDEDGFENLIYRFRANFIVQTKVPYLENASDIVEIGNNTFQSAGPCTRCQIICIDQLSGEKSVEPMKTLSLMNNGKIQFGIYLTKTSSSNIVMSLNDRVRFK